MMASIGLLDQPYLDFPGFKKVPAGFAATNTGSGVLGFLGISILPGWSVRPRLFGSVAPWGPCEGVPSNCGPGGMQRREVTCPIGQGGCHSLTKPSEKQSCRATSGCTGVSGSWSNCSTYCGAGERQRPVPCSSGIAADCANASYVANSSSCEDFSDCRWEASAWGTCSSTCGVGTQSRTVSCPVGDTSSHCPALVPQTVQRCSGTLGCSWQASGWSECSSICGLGESLRDVWCPSGNDADCGQDARPSHNNSCYSTAGCSWSKGPWTACSSSCGSGLHNREVSWPSGKASDCPGQAPVSSEACYSTLGCTWVTQNWSSCDNTCGDGSQTRNVSCSGGPGDGDCALAGLRPSALAACRSTVGCAWNISSWSSCSTEWGPGLQSRDVQCPSGNPLDRGPSGTAPATSQPCCATAACAWSVSAWSQCSNDCGTGEMVRSVACSSSRTADCGGAEPLVKQPCSVTAGCNWNLSAWTACNATCGAGVQSRDASCSSPNPAGCPSPGPAVLQHCYVTSGCAWLVANWDSCGSSCGAGSRQRSVQCPSGSVGDCPGNRPASQEAC
jgi:hypothetical protein